MADVTITRTVGVMTDRGDKDFEIHLSNGEVVTAERTGSKFRVGDSVGTLKEIKQEILDAVEMCGVWEGVSDADDNEGPSGTTDNICNTWDCVDPCAFIVYFLNDRSFAESLMLDTLDKHGWLTPEGKPDIDSAERQIKSAMNRIMERNGHDTSNIKYKH